jgi:hypothetical protein
MPSQNTKASLCSSNELLVALWREPFTVVVDSWLYYPISTEHVFSADIDDTLVAFPRFWVFSLRGGLWLCEEIYASNGESTT